MDVAAARHASFHSRSARRRFSPSSASHCARVRWQTSQTRTCGCSICRPCASIGPRYASTAPLPKTPALLDLHSLNPFHLARGCGRKCHAIAARAAANLPALRRLAHALRANPQHVLEEELHLLVEVYDLACGAGPGARQRALLPRVPVASAALHCRMQGEARCGGRRPPDRCAASSPSHANCPTPGCRRTGPASAARRHGVLRSWRTAGPASRSSSAW